MGELGGELDLGFEDGCVRRVGHGADYVEDSHLEPAAPVLKSPRVGVFVVGEDGGGDGDVGFAAFDFAVDALDQGRDLFALEVGELLDRVRARLEGFVLRDDSRQGALDGYREASMIVGLLSRAAGVNRPS